MQYCPEVPIRCHKNPVNGNVFMSLQKSAAIVNELSEISQHNHSNRANFKHLVWPVTISFKPDLHKSSCVNCCKQVLGFPKINRALIDNPLYKHFAHPCII